MYLNMIIVCLISNLFFVSSVFGAGELSVLHYPNAIVFKGHDTIDASVLPEVYASAFGFTNEKYSRWQGFYIKNPFHLPEAIVTVAVDGVADIGQQKGHHVPLKTDRDEKEIYESIESRVKERFPDKNTNLVRFTLTNDLIDLKEYKVFGDINNENASVLINHKALKLDIDEDQAFLKEIVALNKIAEQIERDVIAEDTVPDIFWFREEAFHALCDLHGPNTTETNEARQLLQNAIFRLNDAFVKAYNGRVLFSVITSDVSHTRRTRSILQAEDGESDKSKYNLASYYSKDYPVIFNMMLWFGVIMFFSILAICLATANMDPGRDSIIYRMTSTRMKKDN